MLIYAFLNGVEIHWVRISTLFGDDQHLAYINTFIANPKLPDVDAEILAILQLLITYIYIGILYIKCPGHVLDITKFMSMDGTVLDVPSMNIVLSHYQHCP